jgi:hypothetical protein
MLDFPAQIEVVTQEQASRMPTPAELLTQTVRTKYEQLKAKPTQRFNLIRSYNPINMGTYTETVCEFKLALANLQEGENIDINKFLPLIFGALEGSSSLNTP